MLIETVWGQTPHAYYKIHKTTKNDQQFNNFCNILERNRVD